MQIDQVSGVNAERATMDPVVAARFVQSAPKGCSIARTLKDALTRGGSGVLSVMQPGKFSRDQVARLRAAETGNGEDR